MNVIETALPGVLILEPRVFEDERGFFMESWNARVFREATGVELDFVQDNHSRSRRGVLRGLHYQIEHAQGKLVRVACGEVLDVAVDLRRSSPHFGRWTSVVLSAQNRSVDYGEYPATVGETSRFVTYSTVKHESTGRPTSVSPVASPDRRPSRW